MPRCDDPDMQWPRTNAHRPSIPDGVIISFNHVRFCVSLSRVSLQSRRVGYIVVRRNKMMAMMIRKTRTRMELNVCSTATATTDHHVLTAVVWASLLELRVSDSLH